MSPFVEMSLEGFGASRWHSLADVPSIPPYPLPAVYVVDLDHEVEGVPLLPLAPLTPVRHLPHNYAYPVFGLTGNQRF